MKKEQIKAMLDEGYNLNQIAAIYMIPRVTLENTLATPDKKTSKKSNEDLSASSRDLPISE